MVIERAWALESQLRKLETLGSEAVRLPPARLRVVAMDRQAGVFGNRVLGTYVATALTHILRQSPAAEPALVSHDHRARARTSSAATCSTGSWTPARPSRTGLVLTYRTLTPTVRERLGRGHAAVAFMRLGNAEDARVASEHVGTEHRLELAQLTETISDVGRRPRRRLHLHGRPGRGRDGGARRRTVRTSREDITESTGVGPAADKVAEKERVLQRSREFLVEPHQLQQLPTTSVIVTDATAEGRRVRLADANPAILTFPKTTLGEFEEVREAVLAIDGRGRGRRRRAAAEPRPAAATPGLAQATG